MLLELFHRTEGLRLPIHHGRTRRFDQTPPRMGDHLQRGLLQIRVMLPLETAEKVDGIEPGLPCLGTLKRHGA